MISLLLRLSRTIGVDRVVFYSLLYRAVQMLVGPITIVLIAEFFNPAEQGFYYTFNSLVALQIIFEMGLSFVITQFASHEFAHIHWKKQGALAGQAQALSRFLLLLRKSLQWYAVTAVLFIIVTLPLGYYFLRQHASASFSWRLPWAALVIATAFSLLLIPFLAALEGSGRQAEVYKVRLFQSLVGSVCAWTVLISGGGLYSAATSMTVTTLLGFFWLISSNKQLLLQLRQITKTFSHTASQQILSWRQEVWPMQWRIAISWISGYFINQIYTPIIFHFQGSILAGQIGMSLTIASIPSLIAITWILTRSPILGGLAARQAWPEFDRVFFKVFSQSCFVLIFTCAALLALLSLLKLSFIDQRILPLPQLAIMLLSVIVNHIVSALAQYLRLHKKEPFVWLSLIGAILMTLSSIILGKYYSTLGIIVGTLIINLCYSLPSGIILWSTLRKRWHAA